MENTSTKGSLNLLTRLVDLNLGIYVGASLLVLLWYLLIAVNPYAYDPSEFNPIHFLLIITTLSVMVLIFYGVVKDVLLAKYCAIVMFLAQIYLGVQLILVELWQIKYSDEGGSGIYGPLVQIPLWSIVGPIAILNIVTLLKSINRKHNLSTDR